MPYVCNKRYVHKTSVRIWHYYEMSWRKWANMLFLLTFFFCSYLVLHFLVLQFPVLHFQRTNWHKLIQWFRDFHQSKLSRNYTSCEYSHSELDQSVTKLSQYWVAKRTANVMSSIASTYRPNILQPECELPANNREGRISSGLWPRGGTRG